MSIKVGILGVGGYTGLELVKLIKNHPEFELVMRPRPLKIHFQIFLLSLMA